MSFGQINTNWAEASYPAPVGMFTDSPIRQSRFAGPARPTRRSMFEPEDESAQTLSMMANMLAPSLLGMTPGELAVSQFSPQHSLMTRMQQAEHTDALAMAKKSMRGYDVSHKALTGIRQMLTGQKATTAQKLEDQQLSGMLNDYGVSIAKLLGVSEETLDRFYGKRGSAGLFLSQFEKASATAIDPVTGKVGLGGQTLATTANRVFDNLYGKDANLNDMNGLSARQAGAMYGQMQSRGLLGRTTETMSIKEQRSRLDNNMSERSLQTIADNLSTSRTAATEGTYDEQEAKKALEAVKQTYRVLRDPTFKQTREEINKMAGAQDLLLTVNADIVSNKLRGMSKAFAAMNKVFGDNGNPNAPAAQVMDAMQKLTNNSLQSLSPAEITKAINMTAAVGRQTGVGFEAIMNSTADMAAMIRKNGGDGRDAIKLAGAGELFAKAADKSDMVNLGVRGAQDIEALAQKADRRTVAAMLSESGNNIGAARRLTNEGLVALEKQPALTAFLEATSAGKTTFELNGQTRDVRMSQPQFARFLQENAGLTAAEANVFLKDTGANQEAITREDTASVVNSQLEDLASDKLQRPIQTAILQNIKDADRAKLKASGIDVRAMEAETARILSIEAIRDVSPETLKDPKALNAWLAGKETAAREQAAAKLLTDPVQRQDYLQTVANGLDNSEAGVARRGASLRAKLDAGAKDTGYNSYVGLVQNFSGSVTRNKTIADIRAQGEAAIAGEIGSLGQTDPIRRIIDALAAAGPDADLLDMARTALGVTSSANLLGDGNESKLIKYAEAQKKLVELPPDAAMDDINSIKTEMLEQAKGLNKQLMDYDFAPEHTKAGRRRDMNRINAESQQGLDSFRKLKTTGELSNTESDDLDKRYTAATVQREKLLTTEHITNAIGKEEVANQQKVTETANKIELVRAKTEKETGKPVTNVDLLKKKLITPEDFEAVLDFEKTNTILTRQHMEDKDESRPFRPKGDLAKAYSHAKDKPGNDTELQLQKSVTGAYSKLFTTDEGGQTELGDLIRSVDQLDASPDSSYRETAKLRETIHQQKAAARQFMTEHGVTPDEQDDLIAEITAKAADQEFVEAAPLVTKVRDGQKLSFAEERLLTDVLARQGDTAISEITAAEAKTTEHGTQLEAAGDLEDVHKSLIDLHMKTVNDKTTTPTIESRRKRATLEEGLAATRKARDGESLNIDEQKMFKAAIGLLPKNERAKYSKYLAATDVDAASGPTQFQQKLAEIAGDKFQANPVTGVPSREFTEVVPLTDEQQKILQLRRESKDLSPEQELKLITTVSDKDPNLKGTSAKTKLLDKLTAAGKTDDLYMGYHSQKALEQMASSKGLYGDTKLSELTDTQRQSAGKLLADDPEAAEYQPYAETYRRSTQTKTKLTEGILKEYLGETVKPPTISPATIPTPPTASDVATTESGEIRITGGNIKVDLANNTADFSMTGAKTNMRMRDQTGRAR